MGAISAASGILKKALMNKKSISAIVPKGLKNAVRDSLYKNAREKVMQARKTPPRRADFKDGVNMIGQIKGEYGLGESCRLIYRELEESGIPSCVYNYSVSRQASENDETYSYAIVDDCEYNINVLLINPDSMPEACFRLGAEKLAGRYNIGYWVWEQQEFPEKWKEQFELVDEIWTPSDFCSDMFRKNTSIPVTTVPYALPAVKPDSYKRADFDLPDDAFLVLMMYDSASSSERKNPKAAIKAYKAAFSPEDKGVYLVIKTMNSAPDELAALRAQLEGYENIRIICDCLPKDKLNALIRLSDVYLSLHRSEGFGLVLAEAMQRKTAVVGTNWSANTEFMTDETSCLVKAKIIELDKDYGPYKKGTHWADADYNDAAWYLRKLYEDERYRENITENAAKHIEKRLGMERAAEIINSRIAAIYADWEKD